MLKDVKILVDEETQQSLDRLQENLRFVLEPLNKLDEIADKLSNLVNNQEENNQDINERLQKIAGEISRCRQTQQDIIDSQDIIQKKLNSIQEEFTNTKQALASITW